MADSVKDMLQSYADGKIEFDAMLSDLGSRQYSGKQPAQDVVEAYARAEEVPDDNDSFWIDSAADRKLITRSQRDQLSKAYAKAPPG
jgi:hypothetical protein